MSKMSILLRDAKPETVGTAWLGIFGKTESDEFLRWAVDEDEAAQQFGADWDAQPMAVLMACVDPGRLGNLIAESRNGGIWELDGQVVIETDSFSDDEMESARKWLKTDEGKRLGTLVDAEIIAEREAENYLAELAAQNIAVPD